MGGRQYGVGHDDRFGGPPGRRRAPEPSRDARDGRRSGWALVGLSCAAVVLGSLAVVAPVRMLAGAGADLPAAEQSPLGATGQAPETFAAVTTPPAPGSVTAGGAPVAGIPAGVLAAYRGAQELMASTAPQCHLNWSVVAGIGKVESGHARGGAIDATGRTTSPILGPRLDGTGANAAIRDTDRGLLDGDLAWDRAVGPTQFIPSTWRTWGADGDGDGKADPNDVHDAAYATGRYLCSGGLDLADPAQLWDAVFRYNHSSSYVATVLAWARTYAQGAVAVPDAPATSSAAPSLAADSASILPPVLPAVPTTTAAAAPAAATPTTTAATATATAAASALPATLPAGGGGAPSRTAVFDSRRDGFAATAEQEQTENGSAPRYARGTDGREVVTFALPGGGKRSEIVPAVPTDREGQERWVRYRAVLRGMPVDTDRWQLILQWHHAGSAGSPPIALEVGRGHLLLANQGGDQQSLGPVGPDSVVDVTLRVQFSRDPARSRIDVWRDGRATLLGYQPPGGTLIDAFDYLKFGLYRDPAITTPTSMTVTDLVVANTAADLGGS